jgi:hypothetical protein
MKKKHIYKGIIENVTQTTYDRVSQNYRLTQF